MEHNEIQINTDSPSTIHENIMLTSALKYADLGWSIIPIQPHEKKPYVKWKIFQENRAKKNYHLHIVLIPPCHAFWV